MQHIQGRAYLTSRSESVECELICHPNGNLELDVTNQKIYSRDEIDDVSHRVGSIPRRITFNDGTVFETLDNDAIDHLLKDQVEWVGGFANSLEKWRKPLILIVIALFGAIFLFFKFGLPVGARIAAFATPAFVAQTIDTQALSTIDQYMVSPSTLEQSRKDTLREKFDRLVALAKSLNYPNIDNMRLEFRNGDNIGANAFALPGGTVIATDQFIELAKNDDEIIAVLAHEIGHVRLQHSLRQIYEAIGLYAMFSVIGGGGIDLTQEVVSQAAVVFQLSASRGFETESDQFAIELLKADGRDPRLLADILERLTGQCEDCKPGTEWLSTHPVPDERIKAIIDKSR